MKFNVAIGKSILFALPFFMFSCQSQTQETKVSDGDMDPRFEGNRRMAVVLDSLASVASIHTNYYLSSKRAEFMLLNKPEFKNAKDHITWTTRYALELLNSGNSYEAVSVLEAMLSNYEGNVVQKVANPAFKVPFQALAVSYLRMGENENCVANHNAESCIVPLKGGAIHTKKKGSQQAMALYRMLLDVYPNDLQSKWLLNIAAMTLGDYPGSLPEALRIDFSAADTKVEGFQAFKNVATEVGVDVNGLSGAGIIEDFNGDGHMDIFCSSYGIRDKVNLFFSDGKGGFIDVTEKAQLKGITGGLNAKQADFNNDGLMDILVLRGAWLDEGGEWPNSLLKNNGDGTFSDVTFECGMGKNFYPTETATWADVNNDGWVDVFIANENNDKNAHPCEMFINNGDGTFTDKAKDWGLDGNFGYAKAASFADFNNDGNMDLFIGVLGKPNYLFMNRGKLPNGDIKFEDIAKKAGIQKPVMSFPAIIADFDHNGYPDILSTSFSLDRLDYVAEDVAKEFLKIPHDVETAKLYLNMGNENFKDVTSSWNVNKMIYAMGLNAGDLNNDGWIDFYAGTGAFAFTTLVPNRVFLNQKGKGFAEVTTTSGMGHLQKGHGVAFGDIDNDGDQDVYITLGGAVEGDDAHNALFVNLNDPQHWIRLELKGSKGANIIGARLALTVIDENNQHSNRYYTVGEGGTFGSNCLELNIGLGNLKAIKKLEIQWPGRGKTPFINVPLNTAYRCEEGNLVLQKRTLKNGALVSKTTNKPCCK